MMTMMTMMMNCIRDSPSTTTDCDSISVRICVCIVKCEHSLSSRIGRNGDQCVCGDQYGTLRATAAASDAGIRHICTRTRIFIPV